MADNPIVADVQSVLKKLQWHRDQGHNVLTADISFENANGLYSPVIETVTLSPNPEDKDAYPAQKMLRIHTHGLEKLAVAANIVWDPAQTGPIQIVSGQKCTFRAVGGLMKADGHIEYTATYFEMDLDVIKDDLAAKYKDTKDAWKLDRDWRQKRQHMVPIAESMARARLIRKLLGVRQEYTPAQLAKPFVLARWRMKLDMTDPDTKRLVTQAMVGAMLGIYGPGNAGSKHQLQMPTAPALLPNEQTTIDADNKARLDDLPPAEADPYDLPPTDAPYDTAPSNPKIAEIEALAVRKGYDLLTLPKPLSEYSERALDAFVAKLAGLANRERQPGEDDIPF
jgi:hypothetical protein